MDLKMSELITIDEARAWLRLDGEEEAAVIADLILAARLHVEQATGLTLDDGAEVPAPLRQAMLMLVGHWFMAREATAEGHLEAVPHGVAALIAPYRRLRL
jgi:uncharacterized phage protein (predicted DNA packaging)